MAEVDTGRSLWACRSCGTDNEPEHCMGDADLDWFDDPRCCIDTVVGFCVCGCEECNPTACINCGDDL